MGGHPVQYAGMRAELGIVPCRGSGRDLRVLLAQKHALGRKAFGGTHHAVEVKFEVTAEVVCERALADPLPELFLAGSERVNVAAHGQIVLRYVVQIVPYHKYAGHAYSPPRAYARD